MYKVLDIFCGAGGLSRGFKNIGFEIKGGIDFDQYAIDTFKLNFNDAITFCGDISELTDDIISESFSDKIDVIIGGPPCQGFSTANIANNFMDDPRNKLFEEFVRVIKIVKPKVFVMENVSRIMTKEDGKIKDSIYENLSLLGYNVDSEILNSKYFGVPQARKRAFFVGIREDLDKQVDFSLIEEQSEVNVYDAISDLYIFESLGLTDHNSILEYEDEPTNKYQKIMRDNSDFLHNHNIRYPGEIIQKRMSYVKQGRNWRDVPDDLWDTIRDNRHSSAYRRLDEKTQSITIDTGHMNYFHPVYNRVPSIRESARLQSFPDEHIFVGTQGAQYRQVGNAVPPLMVSAIAKYIKDFILEESE